MRLRQMRTHNISSLRSGAGDREAVEGILKQAWSR